METDNTVGLLIDQITNNIKDSIICNNNSFLYVYSKQSKTLRVANLNRFRTENNLTFQTLAFTPSIIFDVVQITINNSGNWICLYGDNNCAVVELTQRSKTELAKGANQIQVR